MTKFLSVVMVLMFSCASARAGDPALEVVAATKLGEQLAQAREACEASERASDIESVAVANPTMFHRTNPQSSRWSDARAAYLRYAVSTCVPQDIQAYTGMAVSFYKEELSDEELLDVARFYESNAGRKFAAVSGRLSSALSKMMYRESQDVRAKGMERFESEMNEISQGSKRPDGGN